VSTITALSQKLDCSKYRNGKFRLRDDNGTTVITREGALQTEKMEGKKDKSRLHVTWVDECTYVLKPTKRTLKRAGGGIPANATLTITIIEVKENSYVQTTSSNFSDIRYTSELTRIE
jgi:hypothetical protein